MKLEAQRFELHMLPMSPFAMEPAHTMQSRALLFIFALFACLALFYACATDKADWQDFHGTPLHGLRSYAAELRTSDLRDGTESGAGALFVAHNALRYEIREAGSLEHMILLARLDSGQALLVNPANNACLEGNFTPQRWMDIGYLLEAFPKVAHPRIMVSSEERLGTERIHGYKVSKIRRTGKAVLFGEERDFTEYFWLAEESCIPLRHENDTVRSELTKIREQSLDASFVAFPAACRKVGSFAELLQ